MRSFMLTEAGTCTTSLTQTASPLDIAWVASQCILNNEVPLHLSTRTFTKITGHGKGPALLRASRIS